MKEVTLSNYEIFKPRLDWLSVIGDIPHIDRDKDLNAIIKFFSSIGFHKMEKRDRPTFRSNIYGIEVSFGRKRNTGNSFLKIEFQGQFFADSMENSEHKINMFVDLLWKTYGIITPPKVTRIDLSTDIKEVSHLDLFPDFSDGKYAIITNSKSQPKFNHSKHYNNEDDPTEETGISVNNSRFEFALYERIIKLDKYARTPHKMWYVNYYRSLYEDAKRVLRIEIRLKKELCKYFNIAFFSNKMPLQECVIKSLAHFNHHHRIYDTERECFLEHIDKLFYREEYQSIKSLKLANNIEDDLDQLHFSNPYQDINPALTHVARVLIANGETSNRAITEVVKNIKFKINKEVDNVRSKFIEQKKTHQIFNFDEEKQKHYGQKFKEFSMKLDSIQEEHEEKNDSFLEYLKLNPFIKELEQYNPDGFEDYKPFLDIEIIKDKGEN